MNATRAMLRRLKGLFHRRSLEREMAAELSAHLEALIERNRAAGLSAADAEREACLAFGGMEQIKERARDQRRSVRLESLLRDFRASLRSLAKARGYVATVVLTLVLGIGFATAVFHLTAPSLLFGPPYRTPGELYTIGYEYRSDPFVAFRAGVFLQAYQEQTNVFREFAAFDIVQTNVVVEGEPHVLISERVTSGAFSTLGLVPFLGRSFLPQEFTGQPGGPVVVSHAFWRQYLGGSPNAIGRTIRIEEQPCTVVGVLRAGENLPIAGDVIRPLLFRPDPVQVFDPVLYIIGRLKPGVPVSAARDAVDRVKVTGVPQWAAAYFADQRAVLRPVGYFTGRSNAWVLVIAAAFLFGIACLNAGNLALVRLLGRARELSVRLALGGTRMRLMQLLLWEPLVLAAASGGIVVLLTVELFPTLLGRLLETFGDRSGQFEMYLDRPTLVCIGVLTATAGASLVLVPLVRVLRMDAFANLKPTGSGAGDSPRLGRVRDSLAILQGALAIVLLGGTGLMVRTFQRVHELDLGFDRAGKVNVGFAFPRGFEPKPELKLQYLDRLKERIRALPGVRDVAYGQSAIMPGFFGTAQLLMPDGSYRAIAGTFVSADYQRALGLALRRGRWLVTADRSSEVVINETLARIRFGEADPIGRAVRLQVSGSHDLRVVGVINDVRDGVRTPAGPRIYLPDWMYPPNITTLVLRLDRDPPPEFEATVRRAIYRFDPHLVTTGVTSVDDMLDASLGSERFIYLILRGIAAVALGLAAIGLYSVMAYTARSRSREFGVRLAIGATAADLLRLVLGRALRVAAIGVALGLVITLTATRFMKSLLFETTPYDPAVYLCAALVLATAALAASWLPARRAAKTNPIEALRHE